MKHYIIEVATSDFLTTRSAVAGGADRIELCANLIEGGTTQSYGHIRQCREAFTDVLIYPIIRPRGGDFNYEKDEVDIMKLDILACKELGCDGVVVGLLTNDGYIDERNVATLVELAYPLGVTFHRAFDRCRDPFASLEILIQLGCERVLTSGQQLIAPDATGTIAALNKQANHRIIIMPGSGVRKENIRMLAEQTDCTEFHASLRSKRKSDITFLPPAFKDDVESAQRNHIDEEEVRALRKALLSC